MAALGFAHAAQSESEALETVVVTATRTAQDIEKVPASIAVQTMEALRERGFVAGTDEYRGVTGVFFRRGEGDNDEFPFVSFRGSTGTDGSLSLIDGIPIVGPYEETQLYDLPYDAFERVEILKGPNSALFGRGALYGSTNYLTRSARRDVSQVTVSAGSDGFLRSELALGRAAGDVGGAFVSATWENNDGWREQDDRRIWNLFGKIERDLTDATSVNAFVTYNDRETQPTNAIPLDNDGNVLQIPGGREGFLGFGNPFNDTRTLFAVARITHRISSDIEVALTTHARENRRETFLNFFDSFALDVDNGIVGFNGFRGSTRQKALFAEGTVTWRVGKHSFVAGIGAEDSRIRSFERWTGENGFTFECNFTFYSIQIDYRTGTILNRDNPCFVIDDPLLQARFKNTFWGAFVQDEIALSEQWVVTLGGRYDRFKRVADFTSIVGITDGGRLAGDADAFSPKATLSFRPAWGQIYASLGRGFNSNFGPTFEWDPFQYARPENKPTTLDSYEVGVKGRGLADALRFAASVYVTRQKDRRISDFNPAADTDPTAPRNLITFGSLFESRGVELAVEWQPNPDTVLTANFSHTDPEWKRYFLGTLDLSGNTPTGVAKNTAYFAWSQRVNSWLTGRASFEWYDDYQITQANNFSGGGYQLLTLGANIAPPNWRNASVDLVVTNALDEEYYFLFGGRTTQATHATPGVPRQVRATLKFAF
jgi:outer membrane receptor protein involved in Fe transport